jgi:hypothetical protein
LISACRVSACIREPVSTERTQATSARYSLIAFASTNCVQLKFDTTITSIWGEKPKALESSGCAFLPNLFSSRTGRRGLDESGTRSLWRRSARSSCRPLFSAARKVVTKSDISVLPHACRCWSLSRLLVSTSIRVYGAASARRKDTLGLWASVRAKRVSACRVHVGKMHFAGPKFTREHLLGRCMYEISFDLESLRLIFVFR